MALVIDKREDPDKRLFSCAMWMTTTFVSIAMFCQGCLRLSTLITCIRTLSLPSSYWKIDSHRKSGKVRAEHSEDNVKIDQKAAKCFFFYKLLDTQNVRSTTDVLRSPRCFLLYDMRWPIYRNGKATDLWRNHPVKTQSYNPNPRNTCNNNRTPTPDAF